MKHTVEKPQSGFSKCVLGLGFVCNTILLLLVFCPVHDIEASHCFKCRSLVFHRNVLWLIFCLHATAGSDISNLLFPSQYCCVPAHITLCAFSETSSSLSVITQSPGYSGKPRFPASAFLLCSPWFWRWLLCDASEESSVPPHEGCMPCYAMPLEVLLHLLWGITFCPEAWKLLLLIFTSITLAAVISHKVICCPFQTSPNVDSSDLPSWWTPWAGCTVEKNIS